MPTTPSTPVSSPPEERLTLGESDAREAVSSSLACHITFCGNCCSCMADAEPLGSVVQFGTNAPACGWCAADAD